MKTTDTRRIPAVNLDRLQAEVETMNRRATRLGVAPLVLTVVSMTTEKRKHPETGVEYTVEWANVSLEGESPVLEGWRLVARKTPVVTGEGATEKVENLVQCVPGMVCPQAYRFSGMECGHCKANRRRNDTFILVHEDGRHIQVGRQCIADFLGNVSPEHMLACAEWAFSGSKLLDEASDEHSFRSGPLMVPVGLFLAVVSVCIRRLGWVSRTEAREDETGGKQATAGIAWDVLARPNDRYVQEMIRECNLVAEDRDGTLADAALAWARALPTDAVDYLYNLGVACRRLVVDYKATGLVASAISAYQRHLEREEKARQPQAPRHIPQHVGTVGERGGFAGLTVAGMNHFDSDFGVRTLVRFKDEAGNVLVWWTGDAPDWCEKDAKVDVTGTVKAHDDYKGFPQTVLTRCVQGLPKPKGKRSKKAKEEQPPADDAEHHAA